MLQENHGKNAMKNKNSIKQVSAMGRSMTFAGVYFVFGCLWILLTDMIATRFYGESSVVFTVSVIKGLIFVAISAVLIFGLIYPAFKKSNLLYDETTKAKEALDAANARLKTEIDKRKDSEIALLEAQQLAHIGSYKYDLTSGLLEVTSEGLNICGISREEFYDDFGAIIERMHPDDREHALAMSMNTGVDKNMSEYTCRMIKPDGEMRFVHVRSAPIFDDGGRCIRLVGTVQDITDRRRTEEALKESEEKFRYVFDHSVVGESLTLPSGEMRVNKALCEMLGYSQEELQGMKWQDITHPDDMEMTLMARVAMGEEKIKSAVYNKRYIKKDGTVIWAQAHASVRKDADNAILYYMTTIIDVTERLKAEAALKESLILYRTFVDSSNDMIYLKDDQHRYIVANKKLAEYFGKPETDIIGKTDFELLPKEAARNCRENDSQALKENTAVIAEEHIGNTVFETTKFPAQLHNGIIGIGGYLRDVTERRQAELALDAEQKKARMYFETAAIMFITVDREARVTLINSAGCRMLGYSKEDILGKDWVEHFVPERNKGNLKAMFEKINSGDIDDFIVNENPILTADGTERMVSWRNVVLRDETGAITGVVSSGVDITEQKETLAALVESERSKSVLLSHLPGMAYRCSFDSYWTMRFLSEGCKELTGYSPEDLVDNKKIAYNEIICAEYRENLWNNWRRVLDAKEAFRDEYEITTAQGRRKWVLEMGQGIFDENDRVEALEGIVIDITESKLRFNQIEYLNDHDAFTGLYNRSFYNKAKIQMDKDENLPIAIIMGDINGVRLINDAFGLAAGDALITETTKIILRCCREKDLIARTGGDEFCIISPNSNKDEALALYTSIKKACEDYNASLKQQAHSINLSLGFGVKETPETPIDKVERDAEARMAKRKLLETKSHHNTILTSIMATMFARSHETDEHANRLAEISQMIGEKMHLSQAGLDELRLFSLLHDIGKIGVADSILNKPGKLTAEEWEEMKKHPQIGYRVALSSPEFASISEHILSHHERWDGTGYPNGLREKEIPLLSRILAVADAYDAMTQDRVYRKAMTAQVAIEEIRVNAGKQFDPEIVKIFLENIRP